MTSTADHFNIRWNNYSNVLQSVFKKLLDGEQLVDVTLACEGKSIKCHRVILSACSTYFEKMLTENTYPHLVIFMKDMKYWELQALVTFMYNGEVSVNQNKLANLVKAAEALKIKGLAPEAAAADSDSEKVDDDELEEYHFGNKTEKLDRDQSQSLLRSKSPPKQLKRKVLTALPKLVKMHKLERSLNGGAQSGVKGDAMLTKEEEQAENGFSPNGSVTDQQDKDEDMDDEIESLEVNVLAVEDGSREEQLSHSDTEETPPPGGSGVARSRLSYKYDKEIRDSALAALSTGMSLRQCSEAFGIPRKTLSKWKNRTPAEENGEGDEEAPTTTKRLNPPPVHGPVIDSADRAERLQKAMELALSGVTVRQAAAHYDIPRTTLCAYMKRRGVAPKRNFLTGGSSSRNVRNQQAQNSAQYEDFPFLGLSEMMDELEQGSYEHDNQK